MEQSINWEECHFPDLLKWHRNYLKDIYIPNWERGIDHKYGGFANAISPGQEPDFEKKGMYFQGRAVWMFSYLYNHITHDKKHLDAAIKGRDFLIKSAMTADYRWASFVSRDGTQRTIRTFGSLWRYLYDAGLAELSIGQQKIPEILIWPSKRLYLLKIVFIPNLSAC
jgi:hypothetical protein